MPDQESERREEASMTLGGDAFPVLRCDCDRVFLERNPFLVHRASCPDYSGDMDETPRRMIERRRSLSSGGGS